MTPDQLKKEISKMNIDHEIKEFALDRVNENPEKYSSIFEIFSHMNKLYESFSTCNILRFAGNKKEDKRYLLWSIEYAKKAEIAHYIAFPDMAYI